LPPLLLLLLLLLLLTPSPPSAGDPLLLLLLLLPLLLLLLPLLPGLLKGRTFWLPTAVMGWLPGTPTWNRLGSIAAKCLHAAATHHVCVIQSTHEMSHTTHDVEVVGHRLERN
jgi:hypothetical protein